MKALELIPNREMPKRSITYQASCITGGNLDGEKYRDMIPLFCSSCTPSNSNINAQESTKVTEDDPKYKG
jgi:hypothetical protein